MPLRALLPTGDDIDATRRDVEGDGLWRTVYKNRYGPTLRCPGCAGVMFAKKLRETRFFYHQVRTPECPVAHESFEHHLLKTALAAAARDAGWYASLEVAGDGWRADVLATHPTTGARVALEAQLSPITEDEIIERTLKFWESDVRVCWVAHRPDVEWFGRAPSLSVSLSRELVVTGGFEWWSESGWEELSDLSLAAAVALVLGGGCVEVEDEHLFAWRRPCDQAKSQIAAYGWQRRKFWVLLRRALTERTVRQQREAHAPKGWDVARARAQAERRSRPSVSPGSAPAVPASAVTVRVWRRQVPRERWLEVVALAERILSTQLRRDVHAASWHPDPDYGEGVPLYAAHGPVVAVLFPDPRELSPPVVARFTGLHLLVASREAGSRLVSILGPRAEVWVRPSLAIPLRSN